MIRTKIARSFRPAKYGVYAAVAVTAFLCAVADGDQVAPLVQIDLQNGTDSGHWAANVPITADPFTWQLASPVTIHSSTHPSMVLGVINHLNVSLDTDPGVVLGFNVTAGGGLTTFTISSSTVSFAPLVNPQAAATAAITVTDVDGNVGGVTATGLLPGSMTYQAQYNGGGSVFAYLVAPVTAGPISSNTGTGRAPAAGFSPIAGTVSDIESQFAFTLTANDTASGTSNFLVVPEPSSMVLAMLGASVLLWRARRR